ncbi:MAG: pyrroline-5-carboxylate reductase [Desulfobacteraceae bacterium]|nr:MAG: pyrroline-5-carboxylate reductase [Desulfobacteraceae bacterium]
MLQNQTIGFIGAGNMAEALIKGLLEAGLIRPEQLFCSDVNAERLRELQRRCGVHISGDNREVIRKSALVIYAVKPQVMAGVLKETVPGLDRSKVIVSIAAGVPLSAIAVLSDERLRLIRAMPNVCVSVKAGATAIAPGAHARAEDLDLAQAVFNSVGRCVLVQSEHLLDAVTGLSGSGPAYVFLIMDALADAGVKAGLARNQALLLAAQTLLGAAQMQLAHNTHPAQLKDLVTAPGGTTIAGLHVLEKSGLRGILMDAVEAATRRATLLGKMDKE